MTDTEIIKALECCTSKGAKCSDCPAFIKVDRSNCKKYFRGAIDIINSQKAEIERLNNELKEMGGKEMTAQEALKDIIQSGIEFGAGDYVDVKALKVAVVALEKQTPKKPIIGDTFTSKFQESIIKIGKYTDIARYQSYKCPVCQQNIIMLEEAEQNKKIYGCKCNENFCKKCGQAIDWSY